MEDAYQLRVTRRQRDVAALVGRGFTNRQITEALGYLRRAEAVNTGETDPVTSYCAGDTSVGQLIQAGPGSSGGSGSWRTKRSGCAVYPQQRSNCAAATSAQTAHQVRSLITLRRAGVLEARVPEVANVAPKSLVHWSTGGGSRRAGSCLIDRPQSHCLADRGLRKRADNASTLADRRYARLPVSV